jgi:hypothetical protein
MITRLVDPRDATWEDDNPIFRVYLWRRMPPPTDKTVQTESLAFACEAYDIEGAQVTEVLDWIKDQHLGDGAYFTLYLVGRNDRDEFGQFWLGGHDPTRR